MKLFEGDARESVARLRAAAREAPGDATILNDLAVAYLALAHVDGARAPQIDALEAADRALAADPDFAPAQFNRALALQSLNLDRQAKKAWDAYLSRDASSPYAAEARPRRAELDAPTYAEAWERDRPRLLEAASRGDAAAVREVVDRYPDLAYTYVRVDLLGEWARQALAGDARAAVTLGACRAIGDAIAEVSADPLMRDAVAAVDRAPPGDATLAEAHSAYVAGERLYEARRIDEARETLGRARDGFAAARSPAFEALSLVTLALCDFQQFRYEAMERNFDLADEHGYERAIGRSFWLRGTVLLREGDVPRATERYREALSRFERLRDYEATVSIRALLSSNFALLSDRHEFRGSAADALAGLDTLASPYRRYRVCSEIADTLASESLTNAALDFYEEALAEASESREGEALAFAYIQRGAAFRELGRVDLAHADLAEAERLADESPDGTLREAMRADFLLSRGALVLEQDPSAALAPLDEACAFFSHVDNWYYAFSARLMRARAHLTLGDPEAAETDLREAISLSLRSSDTLTGAPSPVSFYRPGDAFDAMVSLQVAVRGRPDLGFAFADAARSRALVEQLEAGGGGGEVLLDVGRVGARVPLRVTLLEYAVLDDRVYLWAVSRGRATFVESAVGSEELDEIVRSFRERLEIDGDATREAARLYDLLVRPAEPLLDGDGLVVVPSGALADVPFAALYDSRRERYLVEDRRVTTAPSAALYLACLERDARLGGGAPASACVVGNPDFDRARFPALGSLQGAEEEARKVAALYGPDSRPLARGEATEARFFERARESEVIHVAAHGVVDLEAPSLSALAFAPDRHASGDAADGCLRAYELARISAPRARVAVLAACRSGDARGSAGDGVSSLARPFLAAGVPAVVVGLWDVDDRAAERVSVLFHESLRSGEPPDEALRRAQLELLKSGDAQVRSPRVWAPFVLVGGVAPVSTP